MEKKRGEENNWFCRHLERVQTGQREPASVNAAQGDSHTQSVSQSRKAASSLWLLKSCQAMVLIVQEKKDFTSMKYTIIQLFIISVSMDRSSWFSL